jgi:exodeoxyribonuclease V alpha subunit
MTSHLPPLLSPWGTADPGGGEGLTRELSALLESGDLDESHAFLAWQLAALPHGLVPAERAALALLVARLLAAQATGSTRIALEVDDERLLERAPELAAAAVAGRRTPLVVERGWLYTERSHACETRVAAQLAALLAAGPFRPLDIEAAVAESARLTSPAPTDEQQAAVATALRRRLGVIAGGPGTGKTATAFLLLRSLVRLGVAPAAIALCAPTGKAKSRLEEAVRTRLSALEPLPEVDRALLAECPPAETLHRLLGRRSGAGHPLALRVAIVDESSMIDLALMDRLLDALPRASQLVLLGDADQLPSVSTGAVFRDLGSRAVRLSRPFRADPAAAAGRELVDLAQAVRAGSVETSAAALALRASCDALAGQGAELLTAECRDEVLRRHHARTRADALLAGHVFTLQDGWFATNETERLAALASHLGRTRVLCVTRRGRAGSESCNAFLHHLAGGGPDLLPGEPVLVLRNDYERELWNGDQGFVVRAAEPGEPATLVAAFPSRRGWLAVRPRALGGAVGPGYALTVHKAQGSEYDEVLLLLPDAPCPLSSRELLYTAVSRARRSVIVCGDIELWKSGVAAAERRSSGLAERFAAAALGT